MPFAGAATFTIPHGNTQLICPEETARFAVRALVKATGKINESSFCGYAPHCVLFIGADGQVRDDGSSTLSLSFISRNSPAHPFIGDAVDIARVCCLAEHDLLDFWTLPGIAEMDRREVAEIVRKQVEPD